MHKLTRFLCVILIIALVLPYCEAGKNKHKKFKNIVKKVTTQLGAVSNIILSDASSVRTEDTREENKQKEVHDGEVIKEQWKEGPKDKDEHKEVHHKEKGHSKGRKHGDKKGHHGDKKGHHGDKKGQHWRHMREKYGNLSIHSVEDSLPPNVYIVLSDKEFEVKAVYEAFGNETSITKVGVKVGAINIVVSSNGNLAVDGKESTLKEFKVVEFDNGSMKKERRGKLVITSGVYRIFMRVHSLKHEDKASSYVPRIGVKVGVEKSAKVNPSGFIGARISVDPAQYAATEPIV